MSYYGGGTYGCPTCQKEGHTEFDGGYVHLVNAMVLPFFRTVVVTFGDCEIHGTLLMLAGNHKGDMVVHSVLVERSDWVKYLTNPAALSGAVQRGDIETFWRLD